MFVTIYKEHKKLRVTENAWKEYYKNSGWLIEDEQSNNEVEEDWDSVLEEEDEGIEKPISEMNNAELRQYAKEHDIDLSGLNSNKQIREAIKSVMNQ